MGRGYCKMPGLVRNEACRIQIERPGGTTNYLGPDWPDELFDRTWRGTVNATGDRLRRGDYAATARLTDADLETHAHPQMRELFGGEPPRGLSYKITPIHALNGVMDAELFQTGSDCYVWIQRHGNMPWLERKPDRLPSAFPDYPSGLLVGFWKARLVAVARPHAANAPVRMVRAVLTDPRLMSHPNEKMRALHGHEPWIAYVVTATDNELEEAAKRLLADAGRGAEELLTRGEAALSQGGSSLRERTWNLLDDLFR